MSAAGSAVAMISTNLRFGSAGATNSSLVNNTKHCPPGGAASAAALLALSGLGMSANIALMVVILTKKQLRRIFGADRVVLTYGAIFSAFTYFLAAPMSRIFLKT